MYEISVQNPKGETLCLSGCNDFRVWCTGINSLAAAISTTTTATADGATKNSAKLNMRNIVFYIRPLPPVAANRSKLYRFFNPKSEIRIFFKNEIVDAYIDGTVETMEGELFTNVETLQFSIICPDPYFKERTEASHKFEYVTPMLEFPFSTEERTNLLQNGCKDREYAGVTVTVNPDGSMTLNGTNTNSTAYGIYYTNMRTGATDTASQYDNYLLLPAGDYIASGGIDGKTDFQICFSDTENTLGTTLALGAGGAFTIPEGTLFVLVRFRVAKGSVFDNETVYPMIRKASNTADTYQPYIETVGVPFSELVRETTKKIIHGDVPSGLIIEFTAKTDQILHPVFYNLTTSEYIKINAEMQQGDVIRINTNRGQKSIVLIRDGIETNILNARDRGSAWVQLVAGENEIAYGADEGSENLTATFTTENKYMGV